jgi:predicted DNA-binding protein
VVSRNQDTITLDRRGVNQPYLSYMKPVKAMTIRLSAEQAEALETVADVEARPVSEVIRAAIAEHIDNRKNDPDFQDSLKNRLDRARRLLRK